MASVVTAVFEDGGTPQTCLQNLENMSAAAAAFQVQHGYIG
jgi:hypothetical protein